MEPQRHEPPAYTTPPARVGARAWGDIAQVRDRFARAEASGDPFIAGVLAAARWVLGDVAVTAGGRVPARSPGRGRAARGRRRRPRGHHPPHSRAAPGGLLDSRAADADVGARPDRETPRAVTPHEGGRDANVSGPLRRTRLSRTARAPR
ncbi:hypothetical protein ACU686_26785 [Yinghuangia aomiensis]